MSWVAVAVGGAAVVGAVASNSASNKAANAQKHAADGAIAATQQNYSNTAANLNPYIDAGKGALTGIQSLNSGDYSGFKESPDYQFALTQGLQGLDRSAAARGSLYSGGHSADVMGFAQGLASQNYNGYYSKLAGLANTGQGAAANLGSVGAGNAAAIGANLTNAGNAQANGYINGANAQSNMYGQLAGAFGQYMGSRNPPTTSAYSLGGTGTQPYQNLNDGSFQSNGTFNLASAGTGAGGSYF